MPLRLTRLEELTGVRSPRKPRISSTRTELDGFKFDSKGEARRYAGLVLLQRCGQIRNLRRQVPYQLLPSVRLAGAARATPALRYVADFVYEEKRQGAAGAEVWTEVIEDVKGHRTREYLMKRHMMKALLGLDISEHKV